MEEGEEQEGFRGRAHPSWHAPFSPRAFLTLCSLCLWDVGLSQAWFPLGSLPHFPQCLLSSLPTEAFPDQARIVLGFLPSLQMPHPLIFFPRSTYHHLTYDILILTCLCICLCPPLECQLSTNAGFWFFLHSWIPSSNTVHSTQFELLCKNLLGDEWMTEWRTVEGF